MSFTVNGTTGITFPNNTTQNTAASGYAFHNRLINGDMRIDQRNAGASVSVPNDTVTYITDRWNIYENTSGSITAQQSTTAPTGFTNAFLTTVTSAGSATSGQLARIQHRIEGFNIADLGWGTANAQAVTVSFWVRSSLTGTYCVSIRNNDASRSYVATYTINSANTYEYKTVTIPGETSGTWLTNNGRGMYVDWDLGSGSTYNTTAGSWVAADKVNTSAQANWIGTSGATFYVTGVQLEKGTVATSFDYLPYGTELMLCQRYFELGRFFQNTGGSTNYYFYEFSIPFTVEKRATPSMTTTSGNYSSTGGGNGIAPEYVKINSRSAGVRPVNQTTWAAAEFNWSASAEL